MLQPGDPHGRRGEGAKKGWRVVLPGDLRPWGALETRWAEGPGGELFQGDKQGWRKRNPARLTQAS